MKLSPTAFHKLFCSPLLLHAPVREQLERGLLAHMGIVTSEAISNDTDKSKLSYRVGSIYNTFRNVAVVKIHGVIDKMISEFEMDCYGGCDLADVDKALALAANDPAIDTVVLDLHTPGGSVVGTPETAARVAEIRKTKEVHAYTSTMCCSAGYYIASQADQISAAPSAIVGSIGVYMAILDITRQLDLEGIKVELIKAGRLKAMGASFKELTEEERDFLQAGVDSVYADFKKAVTTLRKVDDETMQGQWFDGTEGQRRGLVDSLVMENLDEYVSQLIR